MKRMMEAIGRFAVNLFSTALAALREIFDEAAYARFLNRAGIASSNAAYAAFRREIEDDKIRRPKCC
jgi:hypothetical protein